MYGPLLSILTMPTNQNPNADDLDWDRDRDGRMLDHQTPDTAVRTRQYVPGQNPEEP